MQPVPPSHAILLAVRDLRKAFPGVQALDGVDFDLRAGEVHALVGENGAGKSTLIKILSGAFLPDQGVVEILGQPHRRLTPHQAQDLGIRTIYQERSLVPWMSVSENILLGNLPGWGFLVDRSALYREAISTMERLDLHLDPDAEVASLGLGQQQGVEIAKALYHQARVLIMDEPTAALTGPEVDNLFRATRALRRAGVGHHLHFSPS